MFFFQLCLTFTWKDAFDKGSLFGGSVKLGELIHDFQTNACQVKRICLWCILLDTCTFDYMAKVHYG